MSELKCCPFCGGEAEMLNYSPTEWLVHCIECDGMVENWRKTEQEAIEQWNRRTPMDNIVEKLEDELLTSQSAHAEAVIGMCGVSASGYSGEISAYTKAIKIVKQEIDKEN